MFQYSGTCCKQTIHTNEPTNLRIIITAGYIVESRLAVVIVASVPQRVRLSQGGITGYLSYVTPSVVVIVCNYISVFIGYCDYIVLYILYVVIFFAVINETESVAVVIPQRQNLSGVLPKSLETWNYPSSCLLPQKGVICRRCA